MQISLFDGFNQFRINKPIRLIELFAGYGSQHFALEYLGVPFESYKICEWAVKSIQAYKDAHFGNDNIDYSKDLTKEEIFDYLANKGISANYNEPMNISQIKRVGEEKCRTIYNNIKATHNLVNIQQVKGKDLEIIDIDKFCYMMTYSFPCQDLSSAGLGKGMAKDSGTRSGMLWEVERILDEIVIGGGYLPQILLMENVPEVIGQKNISHFSKWLQKLEELGYRNKWEVLNAKDFGVPQNRERCFMVSILGDYYYNFPQTQKLEIRLKDLLEKEVDEKFYLTESGVKYVLNRTPIGDKPTRANNIIGFDAQRNAGTITTSTTYRGEDNYIVTNLSQDEVDKEIYLKNKSEQNLKTQLCNQLIASEILKEGDVINHSYTNGLNGKNPNSRQTLEDYIETTNNTSPTLTTRPDVLGVVVNNEPIACELRCDEGVRTFEDNVMGTLRTIDCCGNKHIIEPKVIGGIGEKKSNGGTQWYQQDRVYDDNLAISVTTSFNPYYKDNLRIRKLTPKECFRLMGVKDEDFENMAKNQSNASLYHLAGDSIVVDVLMAIFKQML